MVAGCSAYSALPSSRSDVGCKSSVGASTAAVGPAAAHPEKARRSASSCPVRPSDCAPLFPAARSPPPPLTPSAAFLLAGTAVSDVPHHSCSTRRSRCSRLFVPSFVVSPPMSAYSDPAVANAVPASSAPAAAAPSGHRHSSSSTGAITSATVNDMSAQLSAVLSAKASQKQPGHHAHQPSLAYGAHSQQGGHDADSITEEMEKLKLQCKNNDNANTRTTRRGARHRPDAERPARAGSRGDLTRTHVRMLVLTRLHLCSFLCSS